MDNQALIKKIRNAGTSIEIIGLFLFLYNIVFIFILKGAFIAPLVITSGIGLVFLVLGLKIRKNSSATAKRMLQSTMVISLVLLVLSFASLNAKGVALYMIIAIFVASLMGLDAVRKISNPSLQAAAVEAENLKGAAKAKDILKMVLIAIVVIAAFVGISYVGYRLNM